MSPTFHRGFRHAKGYQVSTPYGLISIAHDGREITFRLWDDVRESIHTKALFSYFQQLHRRGITRVNVDHMQLPGLDHSLPLRRGKAVVDMVYMHKGQLKEVELKTHREVGLDITARQIEELSRHCQNLTIVVPRRDMEDMKTILTIIGVQEAVQIDTFEITDEEAE